jgi:hypothetical protein
MRLLVDSPRTVSTHAAECMVIGAAITESKDVRRVRCHACRLEASQRTLTHLASIDARRPLTLPETVTSRIADIAHDPEDLRGRSASAFR